ncbi:hypothetical protein [Nocardia sp. XZ_19_385]|uniref:hypothetical protein n=1 Tax=Nocardia sp. XZ_19_385 TaxID=2769488 RepID=UPI00188E3E65|nr:hypothetical protein [Nocardia sp. XZ_19_385]
MSTKHVHGVQPSDSETPVDDSTYTKPHDAEEDQPMPGDDPDNWSGTHHTDEAAESRSTEASQTGTYEPATESELNEESDRAQYRHEADTEQSPAVEKDPGYGTSAETETREPIAAETETYQPVAAETHEPVAAENQQPTSGATDGDAGGPLFADNEVERLRTEWRELQGNFVDNPHDAVSRAQELVSETIDHLTATFAERKETLGHRWTDNADTEDLRHALRGYRAFFNQLLTTGPTS